MRQLSVEARWEMYSAPVLLAAAIAVAIWARFQQLKARKSLR
jgi:hypothetical protein